MESKLLLDNIFKLSILLAFTITLNCNASSFEDGLEANDSGDFERAFAIWMPAAEDGDPKSQFAVGTLLRKGVGVEKDLSESAKWMLASAKSDYVEAMQVAGSGYLNGSNGFTKDIDESIYWYHRAALLGSEYDKFFYAGLFYLPEMRHKDPKGEKMFKWAKDSVSFYRSKYLLAQSYKEGKAVDRDLVTAWVLLKLYGEEFLSSSAFLGLDKKAQKVIRENEPEYLDIQSQLTAQQLDTGKELLKKARTNINALFEQPGQ